MAENPPAAPAEAREDVQDRLDEIEDLVAGLPEDEAERARTQLEGLRDELGDLPGPDGHAEDLEEELEREGERLEKLWDAYVAQEQEIEDLEARIADLEAAVDDRDETIADLEEEVRDREKRIEDLEKQVADRGARIDALEEERDALRELEEYRDRAEELEAKYEEERERLAKLYVAYQELEEELEDTRSGADDETAPEIPDDVDA